MIGMIIADDELIIRQGLLSIPWKDYDIEVLGVASNGLEALSMVQSKCPEILLTDIRMPGMDGFQLIEAAKKENPEIQTILLTGYEDFNYARTAIQLGAVGYILKPSDPEEIIESVIKAKSKLDVLNHNTNITTSSRRNKVISHILKYIETHYSDEITLITASEYVHMNHIYISRLFKKEVGKTFLEVLTQIRMDKASELLSNNEYKIYEIADKVGIQDSGYFSQVFKKYFDLTPTEYRERIFSDHKNAKEA